MRVLALMIRKDLQRKIRAPLGILIVLVFPVAFSTIIALAFGGDTVPRVHLLVENRDEGFLGNAMLSALDSNRVATYFDVEIVTVDGLARIEAGEGSALLRIPEAFTEDLIDGRPVALELIRNPAQGILPEIAEQTAGVLAEVLSAGAYALREPLDTIAPFTREAGPRIGSGTVAEIAVAIHGTLEGASRFLDPLAIRLEVVDLGAAPGTAAEQDAQSSGPGRAFSIFLIVFPGVSVWSLFMAGDIAMRDILAENEAGTLRRQLHGPVSAATLIAAKAGFAALVCSLCLLILSVTGAVAGDRPVDPTGFVLLSLALVLAVIGSGAAIYGAAGKQRRGATIASVLYLFLAFAGGSFISIESLPRSVQAIAPISPFYWGTQGYRALLEGGGLPEIVTPLAVLTALGIVTLAMGSAWLGRSIAKGGAG